MAQVVTSHMVHTHSTSTHTCSTHTVQPSNDQTVLTPLLSELEPYEEVNKDDLKVELQSSLEELNYQQVGNMVTPQVQCMVT